MNQTRKNHKPKKRVGVFPGSFNPVHTGHLIIAQHLLNYTDLQEIWFLVSPQNPLKDGLGLLDQEERFELLTLAIEGQEGFVACKREFTLPRPSYTVNTLQVLGKENPELDFVLIIGNDNLDVFDQWKDYEIILETTDVYVYPRKETQDNQFSTYKRVKAVEAPLIEISSTFIRDAIGQGKLPKYLVPDRVLDLIMSRGYYKG
jgi:nicotinate-nucleotide adenylyltransferase